MSLSSTAPELVLFESIRPRLHQKLQPLFDESNPCLPVLQSTCQKIMNLMGAASSTHSLAQIISRDHGLTCKVLQVANSIAYSPQQTIASVSHAVSWLGLDTVRSLVAAAHLAEEINHWPERQQVLGTLIAKSLIAATHASELGAAMDYPQPGQLFTAALLYSIGDLAIAYQAPDLHQGLRAIPAKTRAGADRAIEETRLLGVPCLILAQALARMWQLPESLVDLFSVTREAPAGRWQSGRQTYRGVVTGSVQLVEAMIGLGSRTAIEEAKRALLLGSGLPPSQFADLMLRAMDRGRQLTRSMGLAMDSADQAMPPSFEQSVQEPPSPKAPAEPIRTEQALTPVQARPLETLQAFQNTLRDAKDLNSLLGVFVQSLHQDAGFDRVGLALLNPSDSDLLVGRLLLGVTPLAPHLRALSGSLSREHRLFLDVLKRLDPLLVPDFTRQTAGTLKQEFIDTWKPASGILAPLRVGTRPIGLIYCDRGTRNQPVLPQDYQTLLFFFTQTTLGMNRLAGVV